MRTTSSFTKNRSHTIYTFIHAHTMCLCRGADIYIIHLAKNRSRCWRVRSLVRSIPQPILDCDSALRGWTWWILILSLSLLVSPLSLSLSLSLLPFSPCHCSNPASKQETNDVQHGKARNRKKEIYQKDVSGFHKPANESHGGGFLFGSLWFCFWCHWLLFNNNNTNNTMKYSSIHWWESEREHRNVTYSTRKYYVTMT